MLRPVGGSRRARGRPRATASSTAGGRSSTSAGSSSCTHSAPAAAQLGEQLGVQRQQRRPAGSAARSPAAQRVRAWHSSRNVTGPTSTGRVRTPASSASANSASGLVGVERERRVRADLRHQVVVVGVEPLRHLQRRDVARCRAPWRSSGRAALRRVDVRHRVSVPVRDRRRASTRCPARGRRARSRWSGPRRARRRASCRQPARRRPAAASRELVGVDAAGPVGLDGLLQLPVVALARVAVARWRRGVHDGRRTWWSRNSPSRVCSWPREGARQRRIRRGATAGRAPVRDPPARSDHRPAVAARAAGRSSDSRARPADPASYWPSLPRPARRPVLMTAVVPTHRCGAVPDSHRVPSCARPARRCRVGRTSCGTEPSAASRRTAGRRESQRVRASRRGRRPRPGPTRRRTRRARRAPSPARRRAAGRR